MIKTRIKNVNTVMILTLSITCNILVDYHLKTSSADAMETTGCRFATVALFRKRVRRVFGLVTLQ